MARSAAWRHSLTKVVRGALVQFMAAFVGLWFYLIFASLIGWIEPIWWGGKAWFPVVFGGLAFFVGALPMYGFCKVLLRTSSKIQVISENYTILLVGFFQGLAFMPTISLIGILGYTRHFVPYLQHIDPWMPIVTGLAIAELLSIALASLVAILILRISTNIGTRS